MTIEAVNNKYMDCSVNVVKRNGKREAFDAEKANRVVVWACEGLDVSASSILMRAKVQIVDGITTDQIHDTLIKSAADMVSLEEPDYEIAAARLLLFKLRKKAFGQFNVPRLYDLVQKLVKAGRYDKALLEDYSEEDFDRVDSFIQHDRDFNYSYAAMRQWEGKYLVQDRVTGDIFESPQVALALVAMGLHTAETVFRMEHVKKFYDDVSMMRLSLPTPIMAGVRTPTRQFSSCVLIEGGDSINEIFAASEAQGKYAAQRAGIGLNFGSIRGTGAPIRGGEVKHSGTVPIVRMFQASLGWTSQGGVRNAAANYFYPMWHWDFEDLIVLKNNRGTEETRARFVDYGVQINKTMYTRLQRKGNISFFHPNIAEGKLYEYYFADQAKFEELYEALENDPLVPRKTMRAADVFSIVAQERIQTGRIYIQHVDHCNTNSPFDPAMAPVRQSNLCMEIVLPTKPLKNIKDMDGEIALCTLSAINLGQIREYSDFADVCRTAVRSLDNLLDYQNYPVAAAEKTKLRRTLGVGWTNLAYYLAKRGLKYSDGSANDEVHRLAEAFQFYMLKASKELAEERGACEYYYQTSYSRGVLPIDRYKHDVDSLHNAELLCDWEWLRGEIKKHGLRNSTLTTMMPCETSSQITNSTNGIEPPRALLSFKNQLPQIVPEAKELADKYETKWSMESPVGYLEIMAIIQKFIDQSISTNTFYKPWSFPDGKLPVALILKHMMLSYKLGIKTLYYHETNDGNDQDAEADADAGCSSGACKL